MAANCLARWLVFLLLGGYKERRKKGPSISPCRSTHILEQTQHFVISRVIGQEETQIGIAQDGGNSNQTRTAARHNGHILPRVLAVLALAVHLIVQLGNGLSQGSNTGGWAVLSRGDRNVNGLGTLEAAGNVILDLGGSLTQVRPGVRIFEEAKLSGALGAPDDSGGRSAGVETSVGEVAFVGVAELTVDFGLDL